MKLTINGDKGDTIWAKEAGEPEDTAFQLSARRLARCKFVTMLDDGKVLIRQVGGRYLIVQSIDLKFN